MTDIRIIAVNGSNVVSYSALNQPSLLANGTIGVLQAVITNLMTTEGTDVTAPYRGAGLMDLCRRHRMELDVLEEVIAERVIGVEQRMISEQRLLKRLPANERLTTLRLVSVEASETNASELLISLALQVADGSSLTFTI